MAEVMLECQSMVENQAQQRDIRMSYPDFDEHCFVLGDHTRVKQVVINLLTNAIKYNTSKGAVVMDYEEIKPGRIRVSIKDTGKGLTPEQITQLFQAFNRLGQEGAGEEGTGIGLVVAKRLIELMGGAIGVDSTIGAGSVFWFELNTVAEPRFLGEGSVVMDLAQGPLARRSRLHTLLYIEDNPANLKLVEQILTRQPDIHLLTAENGARGIELAHEAKPDLILMDINLPDISGFDALKILRSDPATAHILVMALSANAMPMDIEKALRNGFFRYVTKPIKIKEFLTALDDALEMVDQEKQSGPLVSPSP